MDQIIVSIERSSQASVCTLRIPRIPGTHHVT